jgi:hypothetical protein
MTVFDTRPGACESAGMKTALRAVLFVSLVTLLAACGGSKPEAAKPEGQPEGKPEGEKHGMAMPPQLTKFHDTLAPRWHAERGPQRMTDTCAVTAQFQADAQAIADAQPPSGGDAAVWSARSKQLGEAVAALEVTCKASDAAAFEPAFERVHSAFHGLMEAAGGHHGEHAHGEGDGKGGDKDKHSDHNH